MRNGPFSGKYCYFLDIGQITVAPAKLEIQLVSPK